MNTYSQEDVEKIAEKIEVYIIEADSMEEQKVNTFDAVKQLKSQQCLAFRKQDFSGDKLILEQLKTPQLFNEFNSIYAVIPVTASIIIDVIEDIT